MWYYQITDNLNVLSLAEQQYNAEQFEMEMTAKGWTLIAICGALGNITHEGQLNPGQCENGYGVPSSPTDVWYLGGLGLIGWTGGYGQWPNAMIQYAIDHNGDWWDGRLQCDFIDQADDSSVTHGYWGWIPRGPWTSVTTMREYSRWTGSLNDAADCFCYNCEYPADIESVLPARRISAQYWYDYFTSQPIPQPMSEIVKRVILMTANRKKSTWWR